MKHYKRVKANYDHGYVNAMDKIRVFIESNQKVWYRRVCECLDSTGILHERDKPDPGQWYGTSCLQQRRIISDSQRHLSRQGLWRDLQLFIFFITHSPKRQCRILQRRNSKWCIWFTCLH